VKHLSDVDCYEKETAVFECQFNYDDAPVTWCKDDQASFSFIVGESCEFESELKGHCFVLVSGYVC